MAKTYKFTLVFFVFLLSSSTTANSKVNGSLWNLTKTSTTSALTTAINSVSNVPRTRLKLLWFTLSARNGTLSSSILVYELNAGALSLALREAQASGLVDQATTDVELAYRDGMSGNTTRIVEHMLAMHNTPGGFQVMLGPALSAPARVAGFVAQAMHVLHIVWGATAPEFSDRILYPHIIRPQPNYYLVTQCVQNLLISQNMLNNLAVLYYDDSAACGYMVSSMQKTTKYYNITISTYASLSSDFTDDQLASKLRQISYESRIIFGCGMFEPANLTRTIQLYRIVAAAKKLGMLDSTYQWILFMTDLALPQYSPLNLAPGQLPSPPEILRDNNIDLTMAELVEAMKHFLYTYHHMLQPGDVAWREKVFDALADPPWNQNMTRVRQDLKGIGIDPQIYSPAYMSGHLADTLTLYLMGVQRARAAGVDYENPVIMYDILRNITFEGHSGYFALNRDGERLPDLSLHGPAADYDSKSLSEKFENKGDLRCSTKENIQADSNYITGILQLERPFVWYTSDGLPPPDMAACGYRGELCRFSPLYIVLSVVGGLLLLLCVVSTILWFFLQKRRQTELLRMDWLLQPSQIHEKQPTASAVSLSILRLSQSNSQPSLDSSANGGVSSNNINLWTDNNDPKSATESLGDVGSDAETLYTTDHRYSILKQIFRRATYQDVDVALYKWPWSPDDGKGASSNVAQRSFVNLSDDGRATPSATGNTGKVPQKTSVTVNFVAYVVEHRECLAELLAMRRLNQDNICVFIGAYYENETRQLVFVHSYCHKGTLSRVLHHHGRDNNQQPLQWFFKQSILLDIALGLDYLQNSTQLEFHGRLTSDYIHIDSRWVTKITGFGRWSFGIEHPQDFLLFESADEEELEANKRQLLWTAPELLRQPNIVDNFTKPLTSYYTGGAAKRKEAMIALKQADAYSFGVIMSEVLYDMEPYSERLLSNGDKIRPSEIVREIIRGVPKNEAPLRPLSDKDAALEGILAEDDSAAINTCRRLMVRCWAENAEERPNIKSICQSLRAQARAQGTGSLVDTVIAKLELYAKNLESLVQARTSDLQEEKRRADGLLRRLLPESIAEQLKRGEAIVPQMYESASVYFSDIVSFTATASLLTPLAVVELLNKVFVYMDDVLSRYAVYKMETIGDGYMVVSGLPKRIGTHAAELASMALDIRNGISLVRFECLERTQPRQPTIRIRLGLHSGPVVAGVVGLTMPRYCLFGDTVNVASRMESQGEAMQIQISESTRELLGLEYTGRERGAVKIKGKGLMHTYWLDDGPTRQYAPPSVHTYK